MIIDAEDAILGRMASFVAKNLLKGENVEIINAERAIITGSPKFAEKKYLERVQRGSPQHGPYYPTKPELMVQRAVRGMINYKKPTGSVAFKRLRIHAGIPKALQGKEAVRFADKQKAVECNYVRICDIANKIGK